MSELQKIDITIGMCLSSSCDRGCSHCDASATMKGKLLSVENSLLIAREMSRIAKLYRKVCDISFSIPITGDGEFLINPDSLKIFDNIFGLCQNAYGYVVTSGINNFQEKFRLLSILERPYAKRIRFSLSFNLFQKDFPERALKTLSLLFENNVDQVIMKVCQTHNGVLRTIAKLDRILYKHFIQWVREKNPIIFGEKDFQPSDLENELAIIISDIFPNAQKQLTKKIPNPSKMTLAKLKVLLLTRYIQTISFETKYGRKSITYLPHLLTKRGRAKKLSDPGSYFKLHDPCAYLRNDKNRYFVHLGADGFYYPSCQCPPNESLRLGHVKDDLRRILGAHSVLGKALLRSVISDKNIYSDICDHCVMVANKIAFRSGGSVMKLLF